MDKLLKEFKNPPAAYRGKPFWCWNGQLEGEELERQLEVFEKMGMGGAFCHSRVGLRTEYLSDEWFEPVSYTHLCRRDMGCCLGGRPSI